jgi:uncharacterized protein YciI
MTSPLWLLLTTYVRPEAEVDTLLEAHRAHLERHREAGRFLAWGRLVPRTGGFVLARAADRAEVDAALAEDPFTTGGVATWTVQELAPTGGEPQLLAALLGEG